MSQENFAPLLKFFKVLGNESRLKIIGLLANEERSVGELAAMLGVKEPTVSHHLAIMKELGLVDARAEKNLRIYWLNTSFLESMNKDMFSQANLSSLVEDSVEGAREQKVLRAFLDGDRIKAIPARYKKRQAVLEWLVNKFEMDVRYPEKEVNDIITQYNPDYASLRRYLIDHGLMQRERGVYWRIT